MFENEEPKIFKAYREHKVLFTINWILTAPTLAIPATELEAMQVSNHLHVD